MFHTTHTRTTSIGQEYWLCYNCTRLLSLLHEYKRRSAAAAAGEGNVGLATKWSFDLLLLPLHFTSIHQTVPAGRTHTELHDGGHVERLNACERK